MVNVDNGVPKGLINIACIKNYSTGVRFKAPIWLVGLRFIRVGLGLI